ncbi:MAG TPA: murein biosynthesis integral membrane protein MurJ [Candidatus Binatia bacterium]|nr:murein biosynthesis integral membrane protein MurJ [Candidatus Binatia bacterium]
MIDDVAAIEGARQDRATRRDLVRSGVVVSGAYLASRLLGWVRLAVIGAAVGSARDLDAFFAAFRIPDLLFQLVAAGALSSALVPIVAALDARGERRRAWRVALTLAALLATALVVLGIGAVLAAPVLVPLITPGFDADGWARTVELTRIMVAAPLFLALGAVATSVLNAHGRFGAAALAPVAYNLAIIAAAAAVALEPGLGVGVVAIGVVGGATAHLLVQLGSLLRLGFDPRVGIDPRDGEARRALVLMVPRAIGLGAGQITFVVLVALASTVDVGAVAAYTFAFTLLQIPVGVVGVPLAVVLLPSLARDVALGDEARYGRLVEASLGVLVFVMVGLAAVGAALAMPTAFLLFGWGRVAETTLAATGSAFAAFLLGLPAHGAIAVLARALYARGDTATPAAAAVAAVVVNVTLAAALVGPVGLVGLALAIAAGAWLEALGLAVVLQRRTGTLALRPFVRVGLPSLAAGGVAAVAAVLLVTALGGWALGAPERVALVGEAVLVGGVGLAVYVAAAALLRVEAIGPLLVGLRGALRWRS